MKLVFGAVAAGFFVAVAILLLFWPTYFSQLNSTAYDFTLRLAGPISPVSPTLIVAVDESSLDRIGAWPWSRDKLARLIERIETGRPRVIAVDVLLDERKSEEEDSALARSISDARAIVLATRIATINGGDHWRRPNERFVQQHVRLGHVHADPDFDGISRRFLSAKISDGRTVRAFARETLQAAGLPESGTFEERTGS